MDKQLGNISSATQSIGQLLVIYDYPGHKQGNWLAKDADKLGKCSQQGNWVGNWHTRKLTDWEIDKLGKCSQQGNGPTETNS